MTHIEQMIQDMCPNGIEFKTLGEVCTIETGKLNANAAEENGQYPFFTTSKEISYINEYKWDTEALLIAGNANIGDVKHYIGKFNAYQRTYVLTNFQNGLIGRFLYHYTKARLKDFLDDKKNEAAMSYIVLSSLQAFPIPLPPLEIQKKIVECLDKFSALAAELQAELQLRRKQYEYYRTQLLTPHSDCNSADNTDDRNWEWKTLGEVCTKIVSGGTPARNHAAYFNGTIPWMRTQEVDWKDVYDTEIHITEEAVKNSSAKLIPANCVIIAMYGATVGKSCINKIPVTTNQACCNLEIDTQKALYKYVYYWVCKEYENIKGMGEGSQNNINGQKIKSYKIPLPSLAEQARIVSILDKFEALTTSLSDGIPAEQAAQQKRYEYYRDLLLTFDHKAV